MKKQPKVFNYILVLCIVLLTILIIVGIAIFHFPVYIQLAAGVICVLSSGMSFYTGSLQIQTAKKMGKSLLWWKQAYIIMACFFVCFGVLECFAWLYTYHGFAHNELDNPVGSSVGILFLVSTLGLGIYGIILLLLLLLQADANRKIIDDRKNKQASS